MTAIMSDYTPGTDDVYIKVGATIKVSKRDVPNVVNIVTRMGKKLETINYTRMSIELYEFENMNVRITSNLSRQPAEVEIYVPFSQSRLADLGTNERDVEIQEIIKEAYSRAGGTAE